MYANTQGRKVREETETPLAVCKKLAGQISALYLIFWSSQWHSGQPGSQQGVITPHKLRQKLSSLPHRTKVRRRTQAPEAKH